MLNELKNKLKDLEKALKLQSSKAQIGAELAAAQMKKRIFQEGLKTNLKPIGTYETGKRKGRAVKLKDTGQLEQSIKVEPTKDGAKITGDIAKIRWIERRYGKIFALSKDEVKLLMKPLKK